MEPRDAQGGREVRPITNVGMFSIRGCDDMCMNEAAIRFISRTFAFCHGGMTSLSPWVVEQMAR